MNIFIFITSTFLFYFIIFYRAKFFFGFKESFSTALFFYIHIPLFIYYFHQDYLFDNFAAYNGYSSEDIIKIQNLTVVSFILFLIGYLIPKKKLYFLKIKLNFNFTEILICILLLIGLLFYRIPGLQPLVLIYILICLLIEHSKKTNYIKVIYIIFFGIIIMYLSTQFFAARRDLVKILIISLFFICLNYNTKKIIYPIILILFIVAIIAVFFNTYMRSTTGVYSGLYDDVFEIPTLAALVANYDFMPAFDNFVYILNIDYDFLYGKSLFKIFYSFIPRDIWPSKPLDTNALITGLRKNAFVGGTSQSVTLMGELYWNFKSMGVFIFFFLLGLFSKNYDLIKNDKRSDIQLIKRRETFEELISFEDSADEN